MRRFLPMATTLFVALVSLGTVGAVGIAEATGRVDRGDGQPFSERYQSLSWSQIADEAAGDRVYWYMWGGSDSINQFVQGYVADRLRSEYEIELEMVPATDASVYVSKVVGEKQAGRDAGGSVDLVWINGENFRSMREADLLFGPYSSYLPNMRYVDATEPTVANDFGYPVEGYESPYGSAQMVTVYDSDRVATPPPTSVFGLIEWARANPGHFTYPAPPDFTGSAFVRHVFYSVAGGFSDLLGPFNEDLYADVAGRTRDLLNELEPYLWRHGATYPETATRQQQLFANREADFDMSYNPGSAANLVGQGRYPDSTRTFVFDEGTIGNTHYVAIPYNATHKAAAMALANLLLDPAVQLEKALPEAWGDLSVVQMGLIPAVWRDRFASVPRPGSVLASDVLQSHRSPELQSPWLIAIEDGWIQNVLQK